MALVALVALMEVLLMLMLRAVGARFGRGPLQLVQRTMPERRVCSSSNIETKDDDDDNTGNAPIDSDTADDGSDADQYRPAGHAFQDACC